MHVSVQTIGTRGDVQPVAALAAALEARGARVSETTNCDQQGLAKAFGLRTGAPFLLDFGSIMARFDSQGQLGGWAMWTRFWSHLASSEVEDVLERSLEAARGADIVLASPPRVGGEADGRGGGARFEYLAFQPSMAATGAFPCPLVFAAD